MLTAARHLALVALSLVAFTGAAVAARPPWASRHRRSSCRTRTASGTRWRTTRASGSRSLLPEGRHAGLHDAGLQLRDNIFAFNKEGAVILGISVDDVESHKNSPKSTACPSPCSRTPTRRVEELRRAQDLHGVMEMARRDTFIVDPQGRIAKHYESVDPEGTPRSSSTTSRR